MAYPASVTCFFCTPSGRDKLFLRRFVWSSESKCSGQYGYHNARIPIGEGPEIDHAQTMPHDDVRWPIKCDACPYVFRDENQWQVFSETIYIRGDTEAEILRSENVPGMMWDAPWMGRKGSDDRSLFVILPNRKEWGIDQRATNCALPKDNNHRCWIRTGEPPVITVGKKGPTCAAGAGSIGSGDYHGFLENGKFRP